MLGWPNWEGLLCWVELTCPTTWACLLKVRPGVLSKTLSHMWGKLNLLVFLFIVGLFTLINIDSLMFLAKPQVLSMLIEPPRTHIRCSISVLPQTSWCPAAGWMKACLQQQMFCSRESTNCWIIQQNEKSTQNFQVFIFSKRRCKGCFSNRVFIQGYVMVSSVEIKC